MLLKSLFGFASSQEFTVYMSKSLAQAHARFFTRPCHYHLQAPGKQSRGEHVREPMLTTGLKKRITVHHPSGVRGVGKIQKLKKYLFEK